MQSPLSLQSKRSFYAKLFIGEQSQLVKTALGSVLIWDRCIPALIVNIWHRWLVLLEVRKGYLVAVTSGLCIESNLQIPAWGTYFTTSHTQRSTRDGKSTWLIWGTTPGFKKEVVLLWNLRRLMRPWSRMILKDNNCHISHCILWEANQTQVMTLKHD